MPNKPNTNHGYTRDNYTFFDLRVRLNLIKCKFHILLRVFSVYPFVCTVCLATTGVCIFVCRLSGRHTFYFGGKKDEEKFEMGGVVVDISDGG